MNKKNTKQRIIDTSLKLFNEHGSSKITTRHIAKELKMSPGNLYYHYDNKEAIIRAIFEQMAEFFNNAYTDLKNFNLKNYMMSLSKFFWEYRFFQREIVLLLNNDTKLKEMFQIIQKQRIQSITELIQSLIQYGYVIPLEKNELEALVINTWILSNFWHSYLEIEDNLSESSIQKGIDNLIMSLKPYLTEKGIIYLLN